MKRVYWIFALLLTSFAVITCDDDDDNDNDAQFSDQDRSFVEKAAKTNIYEIELGTLAAERGRDSLVKAYAQMMIDDHTTAQNDLKAIADKQNTVTWPTELAEIDKASRDSIAMLEGFEFDSLYMSEQSKMHQRASTMYDNIGRTSTDPDIKAYAKTYLMKVREHLQMADSVNNVLPSRWQNDQGIDSDSDGNDG
jgi:putative membrane protein